jgi:hypothetical protein
MQIYMHYFCRFVPVPPQVCKYPSWRRLHRPVRRSHAAGNPQRAVAIAPSSAASSSVATVSSSATASSSPAVSSPAAMLSRAYPPHTASQLVDPQPVTPQLVASLPATAQLTAATAIAPPPVAPQPTAAAAETVIRQQQHTRPHHHTARAMKVQTHMLPEAGQAGLSPGKAVSPQDRRHFCC